MRTAKAAIGSIVFFVLAPGTVIGLIPWLLTSWHVHTPLPFWLPLRVVGGLLLGAGLLVYGAVVWLATASFVRWYEEPELARRFGAEYHGYRQAVPAWVPRLRPWELSEHAGDRARR